ncbi:acyl carrier protein [Micromonospora sp. KC207]|uniref:acyl carrier protein n=1 Tax=Micromonospora sp. KC207 TaxID=2530377 RepID=UPI0010433E8A|nr:acyl carrier protein [Micromonospora sp. KC207]TDC63756.1 acyl carrier protein [Micromonospora sp. KC207]
MSTDDAATIAAFIHQRYPQVEFAHDEDIFSLGLVNSLFAMELVMFVEKAFGFTVPTEELRMDNFRTINAITALVRRQAATV